MNKPIQTPAGAPGSLYRLSVRIYGLFLRLASPFHQKARKWIEGRKNWQRRLKKDAEKLHGCVWFHCASLGEFEMARNLIESIRQKDPSRPLLISFFSPSGFEIRKDYTGVNRVIYLPLDTPQNAATFLDLVRPSLACFIKYELWLNFLAGLRVRKIPALLISARVRADSPFFRSLFAPAYRIAFQGFRAIFAQDAVSAKLLSEFSGNPSVWVSSDTRFDRVIANRSGFSPVEEVTRFAGDRFCIVAGSTWPADEVILFEAFDRLSARENICLIIAPHEIRQERIEKWMRKYPASSIRFSEIGSLQPDHRILWIDNIGLLSRLYHYAEVAYVGGAFGSGLHNILEPAVFGCPVVFGPAHRKFPEASEMIEAGGGFTISDGKSLLKLFQRFVEDREWRQRAGRSNEVFVSERAGATQMILEWCLKEGLI